MRLLREEVSDLIRRRVWLVAMLAVAGLLASAYLTAGVVAAAAGGMELRHIGAALEFPGAYEGVASLVGLAGGLAAAAFSAGIAVRGAPAGMGEGGASAPAGPSGALARFAAIAIALAIGIPVLYAWGTGMAMVAGAMAGLSSSGVIDADALAVLPGLIARLWWGVAVLAAVAYAAAVTTRNPVAGASSVVALLLSEQAASLFVPDSLVRLAPVTSTITFWAAEDAAAPWDVSHVFLVTLAYGAVSLGAAVAATARHETVR